MPRAGSGFSASSLAAISPAVSSLTTQPRAYSWHLHGAGEIESSMRNSLGIAGIQSLGLLKRFFGNRQDINWSDEVTPRVQTWTL